MKIYIASSFRNLHAVQLLTAVLTAQGHIVEDWTRLAPPIPADLTAEEAKMLLDSDERGEIFYFCSQACTSVDLLIYFGPAGQEAACEVTMASERGILIYGLRGPLEKPGLILTRLMDKWFSSTKDLLDAINSNEYVRSCRICGCTEFTPCDGGCWWVEDDLCSACAEKLEMEASHEHS